MRNKYKVHIVDIETAKDKDRLEQFLNGLEGDVVSVIPNISTFFLFYGAKVKSAFVIEKLKK